MKAIVITICSLIFLYALDTILVGISFQALKIRFKWDYSPRKNLFLLFLVFFIVDTCLFPMFWALDVTYTVNNEAIAKFMDLKPNEKLTDLFDIGLFEFICWSIQALMAGYIGEKLLSNKKLISANNHSLKHDG